MATEFGDDDPELAAAIEASYRSQTQGGIQMSEEQMIQQAMELSRLEEEARQRKAGLGADAGMGSAVAASSAGPRGGSASGAAGSASSAGASHLMPPQGTRWPRGGRSSAGDEDDDVSDAAVNGGSSRGSSRAPPLLPGGSPRGVDGDVSMATGVDEEMNDAHLAAAIEASYAAQTSAGLSSQEDDLIQQALRISQMEEESRQRANLKEQQDMELQESILMDQMREQEEKRRRVEEEEKRALESSRAEEEERRRREEHAAKLARVPEEPPAGEPGRVDLQIRTPDGKRVRRAFRATDHVGQIYDYIDTSEVLGETPEDGYRLVSTMPRREYAARAQSLSEAGLQGQCALLIELCVAA